MPVRSSSGCERNFPEHKETKAGTMKGLAKRMIGFGIGAVASFLWAQDDAVVAPPAEVAAPVADVPVAIATPPVADVPVDVAADVAMPAAEALAPSAEGNAPEVQAAVVTQPGNVTLDLVDIEIGEAVKLITKLSGASIIAATTNMRQRVSATIIDKPWKPALEMLLDQCDLRLAERVEGSGIYVIGPRQPGEREPWVTESFQLSYLKSSEAAELLKSLLGSAADSKEKAAKSPAAKDAGGGKEDVQVVFREEGRVVSYPAGNTVVVSTTVDKMEEVRRVLLSVDQMRPQVYIEAKIIELSGDASKKIGLDWSMLDGYEMGVGSLARTYTKTTTREKGSSDYRAAESSAVYDHRGKLLSTESAATLGLNNPSTAASLAPSTVAAATAGAPVPYADVVSATPGSAAVAGATDMAGRLTSVSDIRTAVFGADALTLVLSALATSGDTTVVSNPKIIVANEEKATIDMSTKTPYVTVERTAGTEESPGDKYTIKIDVIPGKNESLPYIEQAFFTHGIKVDVTPRINNASNITVTIEPTISTAENYTIRSVATDSQDFETGFPQINMKRVKTVFSMGNGQTAVIGGLTTAYDSDVVKKIPLLGDIPLIGKYLFSHTTKTKQQRETIIFVTVGLVGSGSDDALGVPEASTLIHKVVTPEGHLVSAEAERAARAEKQRAIEQAAVMEPMGEGAE